ncbi:hypothetical protein Tco_0504906 [Tanacetum coccineum]
MFDSGVDTLYSISLYQPRLFDTNPTAYYKAIANVTWGSELHVRVSECPGLLSRLDGSRHASLHLEFLSVVQVTPPQLTGRKV